MKKKKKNLHSRILKGKSKEQHLNTVLKSCPKNNRQSLTINHISIYIYLKAEV